MTAGWSAGGTTSATDGNDDVSALTSAGNDDTSGTPSCTSPDDGATEPAEVGDPGCCVADGSVDADCGAAFVSSVCADAGDADARSHTATANKPRRSKPLITATLVVTIGIERCIAPASARHWLHPATRPPSRRHNPDQSPNPDEAVLFARCSPPERELRAPNAERVRKLPESGG